MFKQIILLEDFVTSMDTGIVSVSFQGILTDSAMTDNTQYSFYTRNIEFINYILDEDDESIVEELNFLDTNSNGVSHESEDINENGVLKVGVFDIIKKEFIGVSFSDIAGDVLLVASLTKPNEDYKLVDARIYFGNRSGAMSITEDFLALLENRDEVNMLEAGFKQDDAAIVFDTVLAVEGFDAPLSSDSVNLKGIHLVK